MYSETHRIRKNLKVFRMLVHREKDSFEPGFS